jgi:uroporphyrin-III C-methyltransferase/precorrin-2 dehydrogenase/sirohydrochlorin ferrochelatase
VDHLPIFLDIRNKTVIVAGGGTLAARRAEMALRAGANIKLFAPELSEEFNDIRRHERVTHEARWPEAADITGAAIAYGAAEDDETDLRLHGLAKAAGVLANVADRMELCDFISPAILDRSPLVAAISSSGASPILARVIKAELESAIPATFGELSGFLRRFREEVGAGITDGMMRRRFWEDVVEGPIAERVMAGDISGAEAMLRAKLATITESAQTGPRPGGETANLHSEQQTKGAGSRPGGETANLHGEQQTKGAGSRPGGNTAYLHGERQTKRSEPRPGGEVYLVGTGPGDPDLLTFRALRLMQRADVVLYDRLIGPRILNLVRRDAERIYAGKQPDNHTLSQEDITAMLVRLALEGKRVLRLKAGDPFIFGRGGEEIEEIARHGIPFQVVPGITAAAGCAAYAGIPLTHRDHAQACVFVTGHGRDGEVSLNWEALIQPRQTVAIYMGLSTLPRVMEQFIAHGADAALPVAVVDNGTRRRQRVVTGTLADIAAKAAEAGLAGPAMIIVGTVVSLADRLTWFQPDAQGAEAAASPGP